MARLSAGVRKRTGGGLEKRVTIEGKRYSIYGKTSEEIAQKEKELRQRIDAGVFVDSKNITLDKYYKEWLQGKRNGTKPNTLKTYASHYKKHIAPTMGKKKVCKIERREVIQLQEKLKDKIAASTVNSVIKTLNIILHDAVKDDILIKNPAEGVKALKVTEKATETYHRALTEEEQKAVMQELKTDYYYEFIALLLCTGMRIGEAAALTWEDIDYKNSVIHITKTLTYTENGELITGDSAKSEAGNRDIPINATIKAVLQSQKAKQIVLPMKTANIFSAVFGGLVYDHAINKALEDARERLEAKGQYIEHFTAHALRDTFATRYIEQGGQPQTLKTILGHSSLSMTMDLYAHVLPNTKKAEMDKINIAL